MKNLVFGLAFLLLAIACKAETIIVDPNGSADFNNIQDAINYSWHGDTVIVKPGTYYENVYFYGKAVTLTNIDPNDPNVIAQTIIDGNETDSVVTLAWGEDANSVLTGFTITNGLAEYGGGICCWETSPTIINCVITNNSANKQGGGIYGCNGGISNCIINGNCALSSHGGGLAFCDGTIVDCNISDNSADSYGGGLYECNGSVMQCMIYGNNAYAGGGLCECNGSIKSSFIIENYVADHGAGGGIGGGGLFYCYAQIKDCVIRENYAPYGGGMAYCDGSVLNCSISNNSSHYDGGGLFRCDANIKDSSINSNSVTVGQAGGLFDCTATIERCIISGNKAYHQYDSKGGGLYHCDVTLVNCIISGNSARVAGGGVYECNGEIRNCVIVGNFAKDFGAGIYFGEGYSPCIKNNIIAYNEGEGIYWKYAIPNELSYNNVWGNSGGDYAGWAIPGEGDISVEPCFVAIGYWADVNDPNIAVEPNDPNAVWFDGDYYLKSEIGRWDPNSESWVIDDVTSPCIDAGDPNSDWTAELWPHGKRINVGGYGGMTEASMSLSDVGNIADLNNDDMVDLFDFAIFSNDWQAEDILLSEDLDRNGVVNFADFAIFADEWLWKQ